jgi:tetratricopeptide (TPR) repeat protein
MAKQQTIKKTPGQPARKHAPKAPASPAGSGSPGTAWMPWVLAATAFLLFATGFHNEMVAMDDHTATVDNPALKDFSFFRRFNLGMYAPVTWFGYAMAYQVGDKDPFYYHVLSAVVHAINTVLVFRLFRRLGSGRDVFAFVVALLFAVHPLQVEAVSWIAGFSTPLFSLFYLLALNFYVRYLDEPANRRAFWLALGSFLVACLAKSAAVTLPLTMLVVDLWLKRPLNAKTLLEKAPFFLISIVFGLLTLYSRGQSGHTITPLSETYNLFDRFLMASHTVLFYWTKLLIPTGLSIWYPFEKVEGAWPWPYYAAPFVLAGLLYAAWSVRRTAPFVWHGVLFYLSCIVLALPYYTIGTFELRSDRYNYLAALGIFAILASLPFFVKERRPALSTAAWGLLAVLGVFYVGAAATRIGEWRNTLTLMTDAIETQGDNYGQAYLWRGMHYGDRAMTSGKPAELQHAIEDLSKAIERNPGLIEAYKHRGNLYGLTKQFDKSVADLTVYLEKFPNDGEIRYNRALSYLNLNRPQEALADVNKVLETNPNVTRAYRLRGNLYKQLGETAKGEADLKQYEVRQAAEK